MNKKIWTLMTGNGNEAVSKAFEHINPGVAFVFPITPATKVAELFAEMQEKCRITTVVKQTEGENSTLTACIAASAAGVRAVSATCSQGWLFMAQQVWQASGMRLPIVVPIATRQIGAPLNIWGSHADIMALRDSGWIIRFAKNAKEWYSFTIQAFPISEHPSVLLPSNPCGDGFTLSHTSDQFPIADRESVQRFIGTYNPAQPLLDREHSYLHGAPVPPHSFMEVAYAKAIAMQNALGVIQETAKRFSEMFWETPANTEGYLLDDAEYIVVVMGGSSGIVKTAVNNARAKGLRVGMLRIVTYRPFPTEEVRTLLANAKSILVLDRAESVGAPRGPLASDVVNALLDPIPVLGDTFGLGGRDLTVANVEQEFERLQKLDTWVKDVMPKYLNTRTA